MEDRLYIAYRNALIPQAERIADEAVPPLPKGEKDRAMLERYWNDWNAVFLPAMDELYRKGLQEASV